MATSDGVSTKSCVVGPPPVHENGTGGCCCARAVSPAAITEGMRTGRNTRLGLALQSGRTLTLNAANIVARSAAISAPRRKLGNVDASVSSDTRMPWRTFNDLHGFISLAHARVGHSEAEWRHAGDFRRLRELPAEILLGAHGGYLGLEDKYARMQNGAAAPFVNAAGYRNYVASKEAAFRAEVARHIAVPPK